MKLAVLSVVCSILSSAAATFPPPSELGPVETYGAPLARTMNLLSSSTPEHRNKVRVLFYGQSITEQSWSIDVTTDLRQRFPNADLEIVNRAIPGFYADLLWKTAEADLYPFYPDLLIFQVYGSMDPYERIISEARARTTADIVVQTDHPTLPAELTEPTGPADSIDLPSEAWKNYVFLPALATRYGCELADIRTYWKKYLVANNYPPSQLLRDTIHLNEQGNYLMAELIKPHLRVKPDSSAQTAVRTYTKDALHWEPAQESSMLSLNLEFEGNRVDLLPSPGPAGTIHVLIDGKKPSSFPELYSFTRPSLYPSTAWPALLRAASRSPLTNEVWSLTVTENNSDPHTIRFKLTGSSTGFDGNGSSRERFVSDSGRVIINPDDWMLGLGGSVSGPLPVGFEIKFESQFCGVDSVEPKTYDPTRENLQTVAQGLSNGRHTLTLMTSTPGSLAAIRVYNPLARTHPILSSERFGKIEASRDGNKMLINVNATNRYVLEQASDPNGPWQTISSPTEESQFVLPSVADRGFLRLRSMN